MDIFLFSGMEGYMLLAGMGYGPLRTLFHNTILKSENGVCMPQVNFLISPFLVKHDLDFITNKRMPSISMAELTARTIVPMTNMSKN